MLRPVLIALALAGCAGPPHFEARYDPAFAARMQRAEIEGFDVRVCDVGPGSSPQAEAADSMLAASATAGDSVEETAKQHPATSLERAQDARRCEVARALAKAHEPVLSTRSGRPAYRAIRFSPGRFEFVRLEKTATGAALAWRLEVAGAPKTGTAVLGADAWTQVDGAFRRAGFWDPGLGASSDEGPPLVLEGAGPGRYAVDDSDHASTKGEALEKVLRTLVAGRGGAPTTSGF